MPGGSGSADGSTYGAFGCTVSSGGGVRPNARQIRSRITDQEDYTEPLPNDDWRDPVDAKRLVGILEEQFRNGEMPEQEEEILDATAFDVSQDEIAEELGITKSAVRNRLMRMRQTFEERVEEEGLSHLRREKGASGNLCN